MCFKSRCHINCSLIICVRISTDIFMNYRGQSSEQTAFADCSYFENSSSTTFAPVPSSVETTPQLLIGAQLAQVAPLINFPPDSCCPKTIRNIFFLAETNVGLTWTESFFSSPICPLTVCPSPLGPARGQTRPGRARTAVNTTHPASYQDQCRMVISHTMMLRFL